MKIALFLLLFPLSVFSCTCVTPPAINKTTTEPYDVIFCGKVDSVSPCNTNGFATAYFTISELYKGTIPYQVEVEYECQSSCLMTFVKKEEWLIYARYQRFDLLKAEFCGHNRKRYSDMALDATLLSTQRSFDDEKKVLLDLFGLKPFTEKNEMNEQQADLKPHNTQPTAMGKLWLLLISFGVMLVVFYFARKKKK